MVEANTYDVVALQETIFKDGKLVYTLPDIETIRNYRKEQVELMWDEIFRLEYPHTYYVDLTKKLFDQKMELLERNKGRK